MQTDCVTCAQSIVFLFMRFTIFFFKNPSSHFMSAAQIGLKLFIIFFLFTCYHDLGISS